MVVERHRSIATVSVGVCVLVPAAVQLCMQVHVFSSMNVCVRACPLLLPPACTCLYESVCMIVYERR